MFLRDATQAFQNAITKGYLFEDATEYNHVGYYMYMYSAGLWDYFKHIETRNYVKVPIK